MFLGFYCADYFFHSTTKECLCIYCTSWKWKRLLLIVVTRVCSVSARCFSYITTPNYSYFVLRCQELWLCVPAAFFIQSILFLDLFKASKHGSVLRAFHASTPLAVCLSSVKQWIRFFVTKPCFQLHFRSSQLLVKNTEQHQILRALGNLCQVYKMSVFQIIPELWTNQASS